MTDKEKKNQIADILFDFYDEYDSNVINRPMIPNIYVGKILDSMQEKPVSIWHDASEKPEHDDLLIETNDGRIIHRQSINNYGMVKRWAYTTDLLNLDNSCNFGKNWKEETVSEDLSAEIDHLSKRYPEVSFAKLSRIAVHIAKWQKDNTIRKVAKWLYANFYISKEYVSETSILPIPKYAHNATMGQFISEFIKHMKKE